ncbi:MAG: DUF459 domain-containing protein [Pseudomonadota bacterium]
MTAFRTVFAAVFAAVFASGFMGLAPISGSPFIGLAFGETVQVAKAAKTGSEGSTKTEASTPYLSKPKTGDTYHIVVLGDSLGDGLHQGLTRLNKGNDRVKVTKKSKVNTGFVRVDRYDWNKAARKIAKTGNYDIGVVLIGLNDLQSFREKGRRHHFKTDGWMKRYRDRIDTMMQDLKAAGMAVYWTSIPITKRYQKEYKFLNTLFAEAAAKNGVRFVDTWSPLANAQGKYTPFHRDTSGKRKNIRMRDGIHFTPTGYLIFAKFVDDAIKADMKTAAVQ